MILILVYNINNKLIYLLFKCDFRENWNSTNIEMNVKRVRSVLCVMGLKVAIFFNCLLGDSDRFVGSEYSVGSTWAVLNALGLTTYIAPYVCCQDLQL